MSRSTTTIGLSLAVALGLWSAPTGSAVPVAPDQGAGWDPAGAAAYLDAQMDAWRSNGKRLRTGSGDTGCISCHTVLPYALARPVLTRKIQEDSPPSHESRLLEDISRRVQSYGTHQLFYDATEKQRQQSPNIEAVLNALILSRAYADSGKGQGAEIARLAFRQLWQTQAPDGSWGCLEFQLEPWESVDATYAIAALAALAVGTGGPSAQEVAGAADGTDKLRRYLTDHFSDARLFNQVWGLVASTRLTNSITRPQRDIVIQQVRKRQQGDGGWSLWSLGPWRWSNSAGPFAPPGTVDAELLSKSDGFGTGLVVYALREAGIPADDPTVAQGLRWLQTNQQSVQIGGQTFKAWRAYSLNHDREHDGPRGAPWRQMFMSNSATAFAVLALAGPNCEQGSTGGC